MQEFKSNGKLLITGEYAVLDGARALAVPAKFTQSLHVEPAPGTGISWQSLDENQEPWFEARFQLENNELSLKSLVQGEDKVAERLLQILNFAHKQTPEILLNSSWNVKTLQDFNRKWGLGTSSTLINNLSNWFEIDAYELLKNSFGGSGYDLAVAESKSPVVYQLDKDKPRILKTNFHPAFAENVFFVYLNRKQDSRQAIAHYRNQEKANKGILVEKISALTESFLQCENLDEFKTLILIHETLISKAIHLPRIKTELFPDYSGEIKSLGGWGGDFILATGGEQEQEYFRRKGYNEILSYSDMVL